MYYNLNQSIMKKIFVIYQLVKRELLEKSQDYYAKRNDSQTTYVPILEKYDDDYEFTSLEMAEATLENILTNHKGAKDKEFTILTIYKN